MMDVGECGTQESMVSVCCLNACWRVLLDGKEAVEDTKVTRKERNHITILNTLSTSIGEIISVGIDYFPIPADIQYQTPCGPEQPD